MPCALALLLAAPRAQAAARLSLSRAEQAMDCPDEVALAASIERILGRSEFSQSAAAPLLVEVRFVRAGEGYEGTVRLVGPKEGVRTLRDPGPGCGALAEAVAVTVALLLDNEPKRTEAPAASPVASWAPDASPPPAPLPERPVVVGSLTAAAALGLVGRPSVGLGGEVAVGLRRLGSVALGGYWVAPREAPLDPGSVSVSLASGYVRACGRVVGGVSARASVCGGPELGALWGDSKGFRERSPATLLWAALGFGAEVSGELGGRLVWAARATAIVPLRQRSFSVGYVGVGYESPPVGGLLSVALGARLFLFLMISPGRCLQGKTTGLSRRS